LYETWLMNLRVHRAITDQRTKGCGVSLGNTSSSRYNAG
jgi:hypothetical protein